MKKSIKWAIIALAIILVIGCGIGGFFLVKGNGTYTYLAGDFLIGERKTIYNEVDKLVQEYGEQRWSEYTQGLGVTYEGVPQIIAIDSDEEVENKYTVYGLYYEAILNDGTTSDTTSEDAEDTEATDTTEDTDVETSPISYAMLKPFIMVIENGAITSCDFENKEYGFTQEITTKYPADILTELNSVATSRESDYRAELEKKAGA